MKLDVKIQSSPVVIGGLGGSGTTIGARLLIELGVFMGDDLNKKNDNLWFTFLFKRPKWFLSGALRREKEIDRLFGIFTKAMTGSSLNVPEIFLVFLVAFRSIITSERPVGGPIIPWALRRAFGICFSKKHELSRSSRWGWKEPNSYIYLKFLAENYKNIKYIHVIRNGLDMAYSKNQNQLKNWGLLFGINEAEIQRSLPGASLKYWIAANRKTIEMAKDLPKNNFSLLNYDMLCSDPMAEISKLINFLGIEADKEKLMSLAGLITPPASIGRYCNKEMSVFCPEDLEAVRAFGFKV